MNYPFKNYRSSRVLHCTVQHLCSSQICMFYFLDRSNTAVLLWSGQLPCLWNILSVRQVIPLKGLAVFKAAIFMPTLNFLKRINSWVNIGSKTGTSGLFVWCQSRCHTILMYTRPTLPLQPREKIKTLCSIQLRTSRTRFPLPKYLNTWKYASFTYLWMDESF